MRIFIFVFITFISLDSSGQTHHIGGHYFGGIAFYNFSKDSSVSERKSGKQGSGTIVEYGLDYTYTNKKNVYFKSGLSTANHFLNIKGGNAFRIFGNRQDMFLWRNGTDTFNLLKTEHTLKTIILPTEIGYKVPIGKRRKNYVQFGLNLQHHFLLHQSTNVLIDTAYKIATQSQIDAIENFYNAKVNKYMLCIVPSINFNISIDAKNVITLYAFPIKYYLQSWYNGIHTKPKAVMFSLGYQHKL